MTESDSAIAATTESSSLISKARDFLKLKTSREIATVIDPLFKRQETTEYKSALALFDCCVANFATFLIVKLLNVYRSSTSDVLRFRTIFLLSESVVVLRNRDSKLSLAALRDVKPVLITCLKMQETKVSDVKILRRIVSFVAHNVAMLDDGDGGGGWDELSDCILELANREPRKALLVFLDLPLGYGRFLCNVLQTVLEKAEDLLLNPVKGRAEDWSLGLQTLFKIGVLRYSDSRTVVESIVVNSANELVKKGMEEILEKGLEDLKKFLARDGTLCKYDEKQRVFVGWLAFQIAACHQTIEESKVVSREVLRVVRKPKRYRNDDHGSSFDSDWCDHLKNLSSLEVLRIFVLTDLGERSRELAIRRLHALLTDQNPKVVVVSDHISVMRQLQPLLITCLNEDGLSESMFKVLGEVVDHVTCEMLIFEEETWHGLRDYIISRSKTEFQRAVYIFQCITMPQEGDEFIIPVMNRLLPEINKRLNPPRERLVDDKSCWVLAFAGAFCAIIHLIEIEAHAKSVKKTAHMMIDSVRELAGRGVIEAELVRRAFVDVECIVKKQVDWYCTSEYKFVKGLLWRLYAIQRMEMESRMVLWRINVRVERTVDVMAKELPENELDWINQPEV